MEVLPFPDCGRPLFEVSGIHDESFTTKLLKRLISYGSQPMFWGDRDIPIRYIKGNNCLALVLRDQEKLLIFGEDVLHDDKVLCLQSYEKPLYRAELDVLRKNSLFIYDIPNMSFSDEQRESMKKRVLATINR